MVGPNFDCYTLSITLCMYVCCMYVCVCECKILCLHIISNIVAGAVLSWDKSLELFVQSLEMDFSLRLSFLFHCFGYIVVVQTAIISSELKKIKIKHFTGAICVERRRGKNRNFETMLV